MALFQITLVASDNSSNTSSPYLNPAFVQAVNAANAGDTGNFATAQCAITYQEEIENSKRTRRLLTASTPAAVAALIAAAQTGIAGAAASGDATLVAGTVAVTIPGLTTASKVVLTRHTAGGTVTATVEYFYAVTANTLTITAAVAAGTINTADTSVITYAVVG